jgi:hypothetical protein
MCISEALVEMRKIAGRNHLHDLEFLLQNALKLTCQHLLIKKFFG